MHLEGCLIPTGLHWTNIVYFEKYYFSPKYSSSMIFQYTNTILCIYKAEFSLIVAVWRYGRLETQIPTLFIQVLGRGSQPLLLDGGGEIAWGMCQEDVCSACSHRRRSLKSGDWCGQNFNGWTWQECLSMIVWLVLPAHMQHGRTQRCRGRVELSDRLVFPLLKIWERR